MPSATWWACYALWASGMVAVALRMKATVPYAYMDEICHVPQAQKYCMGAWKYWDPALTTPPGLYLFPAFLAYVQHFLVKLIPWKPFAAFDPCSLPSLRGLNLLLCLTLPFLYTSILRLRPSSSPSHAKPTQNGTAAPSQNGFNHYHNGTTPKKDTPVASSGPEWEALIFALFPLVGWWSWLFYTDLASLVSVLLFWREGLRGRYWQSALLGAVSLWFRQTNIVWLAAVAGQAVIARLKEVNPALTDPSLSSASSVSLVSVPLSFLITLLRNPRPVLPIIAAYIPVFLAGAAFVVWNGGIVLGDKEHHVATLHVPQLYYLIAFAGVFFSPHLLGVRSLTRVSKGLAGSVRRAVVSLIALAGMCWTIKRFTIAHRFLLADNRHYTFYVWRRVFNVHPLARYVLAPGYLVAGSLLFDALAQAGTMSFSTFLLFCGATAAVLVPSPLIEPRYFIIPLVILRLYLTPRPTAFSSRRRRAFNLVLEAALYFVVQAACVYMFLERPFFWSVELEEKSGQGWEGDFRKQEWAQRFMW